MTWRRVAIVLLVMFPVIGCGGGDDSPNEALNGTASDERTADELAALGPVRESDYEATISCTGKQGIFPKAVGRFTNHSGQSTFFHVWVEFRRGGRLVDASVAYTETLDDGETGSFDTLTNVQDADSCTVACVDRDHPTDPNRRENCRAYADNF